MFTISTRIVIHHWIISTIRIQIQSIPLIHILLHKPAKYRVIVSRSQIILFCLLVILLACVTDSVG